MLKTLCMFTFQHLSTKIWSRMIFLSSKLMNCNNCGSQHYFCLLWFILSAIIAQMDEWSAMPLHNPVEFEAYFAQSSWIRSILDAQTYLDFDKLIWHLQFRPCQLPSPRNWWLLVCTICQWSENETKSMRCRSEEFEAYSTLKRTSISTN
jgi:hypothetical protein